MIVFDLSCDDGHRFEGWFSSSDDYDLQVERGQLTCPQCGSLSVVKAPMAPAVAMKGNQMRRGSTAFDDQKQGEARAAIGPSTGSNAGSTVDSKISGNANIYAQPDARAEQQVLTRGELPPEVSKALENLAQAQKKALESSKWVGSDFAEQSRAMHYGERDSEVIHGRASIEEAEELLDEGICVAPLPFPIGSPEDVN